MAYNTGNPTGSTDPRDLSDNSDDIDVWATDRTKLTHPDRKGVARKTWHGIEQQVNDLIIAGGQVFPDEPTGRAAVDDGQYFYAESADNGVLRTLWRRITSGVESEKIGDDPSGEQLNKAFTDVNVYFSDAIVYDADAQEITFPSGIATRADDGVLYSFAAVTLEAPTLASNRAYYYYYDLSETVDHPIKVVDGSGNVQPLQDGGLRKIGTIYKGSWSNSEYAFRTVDQPVLTPSFLKTIIPNGNRDPRSETVRMFGDTNPTALLNSPFVEAPAALAAIGIEQAVYADPADGMRGNYVVHPVNWASERSPVIFCAIAVYDPSGQWDFGGDVGPYHFLKVSGGVGGTYNKSVGALELVKTIDANTRVYGLSVNVDPLLADEYLTELLFGMQVPVDAEFYFGGFWTSISAGAQNISVPITLDDTFWPLWKKNDSTYFAEPAATEPPPSAVAAIVDAMANPLHSLQIRLIGDSITWGDGASGNSPTGPRTGELTDPRNNLDARTWANWMRDYLGSWACGVMKTRTDLGAGGSIDERLAKISPVGEGVKYFHPVTGRELVPTVNASGGVVGGTYHGKVVDINTGSLNTYNADITVELTGDNITFGYTQFTSTNTTDNSIDVYVDGVLTDTFTFAGPSAAYGQKSPKITFPFGKHTIVAKRRTEAEFSFRFEGIEVDQKIVFWNDGIMGSSTSSWVPPNGLLPEAMTDADEVFVVMLGTNNRGAGQPNRKQFVEQYKQILDYLLANDKKVIVAASSVANIENEELPGVYDIHMNEVAAKLQQIAAEYNLDFINQYAHTLSYYIAGDVVSDDTLHPNDLGHKLMFDNIKDTLMRAVQ